MRYRSVDADGTYLGYSEGKRYGVRECTPEDFENVGLKGDLAGSRLCPDFEGEEDLMYLMNNKEAAQFGGLNAT